MSDTALFFGLLALTFGVMAFTVHARVLRARATLRERGLDLSLRRLHFLHALKGSGPVLEGIALAEASGAQEAFPIDSIRTLHHGGVHPVSVIDAWLLAQSRGVEIEPEELRVLAWTGHDPEEAVQSGDLYPYIHDERIKAKLTAARSSSTSRPD